MRLYSPHFSIFSLIFFSLFITTIIGCNQKPDEIVLSNDGDTLSIDNDFEAPESGITLYDSTKSFNGITTVGGHFYIDMYGNEVFRREGDLCYDYSDNQYFAFLDSGSLCSFVDNEIKWELKINAHHELLFDNDSTLAVLGTMELLQNDADTISKLYHLLYKITPRGEVLKIHSFADTYNQLKKQMGAKLDSVRAKNLKFVHEQFGKKTPVVHSDMHINSFWIIPENSLSNQIKAFKPGNYIFSCFYNNLMFILDRETYEVVWYYVQEESFLGQHSVKVDEKGNISFFLNNLMAPNGDLYSAVRILNPLNNEIIWEFSGNPQYSIHSLTQGHYQFLPNKNLLVTINNRVLEDNGYGYVLEVDSNNTYVWKWVPENFHELAEKREGFYRVERVIE
jgi:hypothetical protein